jgi:hypothetical protein
VIASGGGDRTVRVRRLADGTPLARWTCLDRHGSSPIHGSIIVTAVRGDIALHSQPLHDPYEIASCSAASADRYDHQIMAGYPVHQATTHGRGPGNGRAAERDSGTLSGTSID